MNTCLWVSILGDTPNQITLKYVHSNKKSNRIKIVYLIYVQNKVPNATLILNLLVAFLIAKIYITWYSWKHHMACKKCDICYFLKHKESWLELIFGSSFCQVQIFLWTTTFFKVQMHSTRLDTESTLKKCRMSCFHDTMFDYNTKYAMSNPIWANSWPMIQ